MLAHKNGGCIYLMGDRLGISGGLVLAILSDRDIHTSSTPIDQLILANAKKDHALLIDTGTLTFEHISFELDDYTLILIDTSHPLPTSSYDSRRSESEQALKLLIEAGKLNTSQSLIEADMQDIAIIEDAVIRRRARYILSENIRVKHAVAYLDMGDLHTFGRLLNASHISLKEDYEVTNKEMDTLAESAPHIDGCLGAGGADGYAIALVKKSKISSFKEILSARYYTVTGLDCGIYECSAVDA